MKSVFAFLLLMCLSISYPSICYAQLPTPSESNITESIQLPLGADGTILVVPNLINKQSHLSWSLLEPGQSNINSLSWHDAPFDLSDSTYPAITGLTKKAGSTNQFYIIYQNGTIAQSTASASGISAPVVLGRDTNYAQFGYTKLAGSNPLYLLMSNGQIDLSRDGGQSWQPDTAGAPLNSFVDMTVDGYGNAYAFYFSGSSTLYKQDAASGVWSPMSFPGQLPITIYSDRRNHFYISTYGNGVYYSRDTGNSWTRSNTTLGGARGASFADDVFGNIYMVANGGTQLFRSVDSGANWSEIEAPLVQLEADSNNIYVINTVSGDSVLSVSTIYGVFLSADQGMTWTQTIDGLHETQFNGFYKTASGCYIETSNNGLFYKDPAASSFTRTLPARGYGYAGAVLSDTLGNIYTTTHLGGLSGTVNFIEKSSNDGTSWQPDTLGLSAIRSAASYYVDEYGNEHLSGSGSFGVSVLYKKATGSNAYVIDTAGIPNGHLGPYYSVNTFLSDDAGHLYVAGGGNASYLTCLRRPVSGGSWILDTVGLPGYQPIITLTRDYAHHMIASTGAGIYYRDTTWTSMPIPPLSNGGYLGVDAIAADMSGGIIASFTYSPPSFVTSWSYGIYCTHDLGASWTPVGLKGTKVYSLYNFGDTTFALSDLGIYALTCSGINGVLGISEVADAPPHGLKLYPNPATTDCHAVWELSSVTAGELRITDLSGRLIRSLAIPAGAGEIGFDTSEMVGGVYLCTLRSDGAVVGVEKLIISK